MEVKLEKQGSLLRSCLTSGLGGLLPTLCKIAASISSDPNLEIVGVAHLATMAAYFLIACIVCIGLQERRLREAFLLGIAAPALVTSYLAGLPASPAHERLPPATAITTSP